MRRRAIRAAAAAFIAISTCFAPARVHGQVPPRSASTPKEQVDDAFIAYLHGIIVGDLELDASADDLQREFPEFIPSQPTPFLDIVRLTWSRAGGDGSADLQPGRSGVSAAGETGAGGIAGSPSASSRLTVQFSVPLDYEVPVDILGHHPAVLLGSRTIGFDEVARSRAQLPGEIDVPEKVTEVVVLQRSTGFMRVDFAGWLDWISGRLIEDVDVTTLALVRYDGIWNALMGGYSPDGLPLTGVVNLKRSAFRVRPPRRLARFARELVTADW